MFNYVVLIHKAPPESAKFKFNFKDLRVMLLELPYKNPPYIALLEFIWEFSISIDESWETA